MKINYNDWFYDYHKYLKDKRKNNNSFSDTKWVTINSRYRRLIDLSSELMEQQPFGVVGTNDGFDKLINLLSESNYSFEDINDTLVNTYNMTLQNAMSKMVVNTHAVISSCKSTDKRGVVSDKFSHYYIIDVPWNQFHFGNRDEFIRQKLQKMHTKENDYYMPLSEFNKSEYGKIIGFTLLCCTNGYISNDSLVAIDDKGFKFKIGWNHVEDCEFIIYKLDKSYVLTGECDVSYIHNEALIPLSCFNINENDLMFFKDNDEYKCIVSIYDKTFVKTQNTIPTFGVLTKDGLRIKNVQRNTVINLSNDKTKSVSVTVYAIKYLNEIPNLYPAVNYYDLRENRKIYTYKKERVKNSSDEYIYGSNVDKINKLKVCTPPIVIDRDSTESFEIITNCFKQCESLREYTNEITKMVSYINSNISKYTISVIEIYPEYFKSDLKSHVIDPLTNIVNAINEAYNSYLLFANVTSIIDSRLLSSFDDVHQRFNALLNISNNIYNYPTTFHRLFVYMFDELYDNNFSIFLNKILSPLQNTSLDTLKMISYMNPNMFSYDMESDYNKYKRPISEQCFISLKYNKETDDWVFCNPKINHFNGIQNAFYIDENLTGDEIFKMFILYAEEEGYDNNDTIETLTESQIFDFDKFCDEVNNHIGYIRYWNAENKLLKLSHILNSKYDSNTCVHILSKILNGTIDENDLLEYYDTDINYEESNMTSSNYNNYDDNSCQAPFVINFLFYTLKMAYANKNKLQSYMLRDITDNKFSKRYVDMNIDELIKDQQKSIVNYSQFYTVPETINTCAIPIEYNNYVFYGCPLILNNNGSSYLDNVYRYTFNVFDEDTYNYLIDNNEINESFEVTFTDVELNKYNDDIYACNLITKYLDYMYDYISDIQTNYQISFKQTSLIDTIKTTITNHKNLILSWLSEKSPSFKHDDTLSILNKIIINNSFIDLINDINNETNEINRISYQGRSTSIVNFFNMMITNLRRIYIEDGYKHFSTPRIRKFFIHLKKINTQMNLYEFKQWLLNTDTELLSLLDSLNIESGVYPLTNDYVFEQMLLSFNAYKDNAINNIDLIINNINELTDTLKSSYTDDIVSYCYDIMTTYIFDLYCINDISFDNMISYSQKPYVCVITMQHDIHTNIPNTEPSTGNVSFIFYPITDKDGDYYKINSLSKICEYTFFNGDELNSLSMKVYDHSMNLLNTISVDLTFTRISSTSDISDNINQIININNTRLELLNQHETFDIVSNDIVNDKFDKMNYEMLISNHFKLLNHDSELILMSTTYQQGSCDILCIDNQVINKYINEEYGKHKSSSIYFKPTQVLHIPIEDDVLTSVNGKYKVGQRIYLSNDDNTYIFPCIITSVDHSQSHGFIECNVDYMNCDWLKIEDNETLLKYLTTDIECHVIPDNISNFMDEFNDSTYSSYYVPLLNVDVEDEYLEDCYSFPGDPLFVNSNSDYVYTRLNWIIEHDVPNRIVDNINVMRHFVYLGTGVISDINPNIKIKMMNHNMNILTDNEMYPILRQEPNDHKIYNEEIITFNNVIQQYEQQITNYKAIRANIYEQIQHATTEYERDQLTNELSHYDLLIEQKTNAIKRVQYYIRNRENMSTWYNVNSYDAAIAYIDNGRAKTYSTFKTFINDISYTDDMNIFIYDWENKSWVSPALYTIEKEVLNNVSYDNYDDYKTNDVLHSLTITPLDGFPNSKKLLIYLSYDKSNAFDDITINDNVCNVKFKPLLTLPKNPINYEDLYSSILIRKHFDGNETYVFDSYNPTDISIDECYHVKRINHNGKYINSPELRFKDLTLINDDTEYDYKNMDLYVRIPFKDIETSSKYHDISYSATINQPIESFVENTVIKLITISQNYDGNISMITFDALTSIVDDEQHLEIIQSSNNILNIDDQTEYICTVFRDPSYSAFSGIITVTKTIEDINLIDSLNQWIKIPSTLSKYRILPNEFIVVPHDITIDTSQKTYITLNNHYDKDSDDEVVIDNSNDNNPYEYYINTLKEYRYPLTDTIHNQKNKRLIIDKSLNDNIQLVKSTYLHVCRCSISKINENGIIDLTSYIPTPISRDRYEVWVNGKYIHGDDLHIISPTSIQLTNLTSLRNFELIELVDDFNDSMINIKDSIYVDLNGNMYSSYQYALLSNSNIIKQYVGYRFFTNEHEKIYDYTDGIIDNPNNKDIEEDILSSIVFTPDSIITYDDLHNIPKIDNVPLYHLRTMDLNFKEVSNETLLSLYDKIWVKEITTNPFFDMKHTQPLINELFTSISHVDDGIKIRTYGNITKYFSLYVSNNIDDSIDDVDNTLLIIPFISCGMNVFIEDSYQGKYLHATCNHKPILL